MKLGVITANFNPSMGEALKKGAMEALLEKGVEEKNIYSMDVPGVLEIPVAAAWLLKDHNCDGLVVLGVVIQGETDHYDYVCRGVERGCTHLQLETRKPIGSGILTVKNKDQAWERITGSRGNKGRQAAEAVMIMLKEKMRP